MNNDYDKMKNLNDDKTSSDNFDDVFKLVNETKNIHYNVGYRDSIIPNFRNNLDKKSKTSDRFSIKHSFALIVFIVAGYFLTSTLTNKNNDSIESTLTNLNTEEINLIADDYDLTISAHENVSDENSQIIDSLYSEHFSKTVSNVLSEESRIDVTEAYELSDVENLLSEDEVDQLYSALIEKEIL